MGKFVICGKDIFWSDLHLQQMMQGAATRRTGEARTSRMPKPAKIPITFGQGEFGQLVVGQISLFFNRFDMVEVKQIEVG